MTNIKVRLESIINREIKYPDGRSFYSIEGSFRDIETDEYVVETDPTLNDELENICELYTDLYGEPEDMVVEYEVTPDGEVVVTLEQQITEDGEVVDM